MSEAKDCSGGDDRDASQQSSGTEIRPSVRQATFFQFSFPDHED
jgi:hypothetical protein